MSGDNSVRRFRTWKFSLALYTSILPEAMSGLHPSYDPTSSFTPVLPCAYQLCNHGWAQSGLPSGLNCFPKEQYRDEFKAPTES